MCVYVWLFHRARNKRFRANANRRAARFGIDYYDCADGNHGHGLDYDGCPLRHGADAPAQGSDQFG